MYNTSCMAALISTLFAFIIILKPSQKLEITEQTIEDLRLGLEVSTLLELLPEQQFTTFHLSKFLASEKLFRPFSHIK